jgi:hypothetical protein
VGAVAIESNLDAASEFATADHDKFAAYAINTGVTHANALCLVNRFSWHALGNMKARMKTPVTLVIEATIVAKVWPMVIAYRDSNVEIASVGRGGSGKGKCQTQSKKADSEEFHDHDGFLMSVLVTPFVDRWAPMQKR